MKIRAVVLAAGQGVRMRSDLPKVMHPILGRSLVSYVVEAARQVTGEPPVLVVGYGAEKVRQALGESAQYVTQGQQLGTGHAVQQAEALLSGEADQILVAFGDMPLLTSQTLQQVVDAQQAHAGPLTMLSVTAENPRGFGRVLRGPGGGVVAIVEEAQCTPEQLQIHELNASVYCFQAEWLWQALHRIPLSPKGEYYLTDVVGLAVADGLSVQAVQVADPVEAMGINNRVHLAEATALMRRRINTYWMLEGVTLIDPETTYIETGASLGRDTVIWPNTYLYDGARIGERCQIGPNTMIRQTQVGNDCVILSSSLEGAIVEDEVHMGPFARLRKGAHLGRGVHMGNFGEVKSSYLAPGVKMGHFSYIGDAQIGEDTNIGAGTITCNYDGKNKHKTEIGRDVFIGSDTMLVAPLKLGDGARTGAGSVVTHDVPDQTLVVGVPARPLRKLENRD